MKTYDIVISFAGENRNLARAMVKEMKKNGISVFFDEDVEDELLGKNLYSYLQHIYRDCATFFVCLVSDDYLQKPWTKKELESAQEKAFYLNREYILPIYVDNYIEVPGIPSTVGYISLSTHSIKSVAKSIAKKVDKFNKEQDLTLYMKNFCKNIQNGYSFIVRCVCSYGKSSKIIESQMIIEMVALQKNILIKYAHNLHRELYEFLLQALSTINDYINGPILSIYELVPIQRIYQIFIKLFCEWKAHNFDNDYDFGPFIEKYEASTTIFEETKNAIDAIGECLKNKSQLTFTKYLTEISKLMLFEDNVCNFPDSALEFIIHQLEEDDFVEEFRQMFNSSPTVKDELEK